MKYTGIEEIKEVLNKRGVMPIQKYRHFAVLMPVVEKDGELHVVFEVRARKMKHQPGEICFPGGKAEVGETAEMCALRETFEELGIDRDNIEIISELDCEKNYSGFDIYCFLGMIDGEAMEDMNLSKEEVEEVFTVPLSFFIENEPYVYMAEVKPEIRSDFPYERFGIDESYPWRKTVMDVPLYEYNGRKIWGLTARLIHGFVKRINE